MTKPEWGSKRTCLNCGTRFYDMQRTPIVCPKCGSENAPDAVSKARRGMKKPAVAHAAVAAAVTTKAKTAVVAADDDALDDVDVEVEVEVEDDDVDDALMEDASDLAEDDDMSEMMEHLAPGEED
ncbi:TIGR02300 family protein [Oleispirillum naphthae]|uniref:TIGR02300 family protein n=1 Tax=Oleispirillum naphthae TaxID=2838853 RepID=UPI0030826B45